MRRWFWLWFGLLVRVFRLRRSLLLENLALRQQLTVLKRKHPKPKLRVLDKRGQCLVLGNHSAGVQPGHRVSAELFAGVVAELDAHEAALQAFLVTRGTDSASESSHPAAPRIANITGLG